MAIKDMKGTVTTTGMMNEKPISKAPDMSGIKMPTKPKQVAQKPVPQNTPREESLLDKVQNLTNEDKAVLTTVLSPSVSKVLSKIAPDLNPLLTQFTKDEENVTLPVSVVKNFAARKYGGTEVESVQSFVADLTGQMDQQPVPPDTQMVQNQEPESDINYNAIDSDMTAIT
tara:strand:- start:45 stop:557 length:513 start_codon:yes stop_codon:yes gene_type:complete